MNASIERIFSNLDRWRNLPCYQLERRFDIFLSPYLCELVESHVNEPLTNTIIPEMPLKQASSNLTDKVDYVLFSASGKTAYLIELKTDCDSDSKKQDKYLERVAERGGWRRALSDVPTVVAATRK